MANSTIDRGWTLAQRAYEVAQRVPALHRALELLSRVRRAVTPARGFSHSDAQRYELRHNDLWLQQHHTAVWPLIKQANDGHRSPTGFMNELAFREFFADDPGSWDAFVEWIDGRAVLDIGGGPLPFMVFWPWARKRILLDPLGQEYSRVAADLTGRSWFDDLTIMAEPAERFVPQLAGSIDGAIVCRNTLDHTREPYLVLSNLASYAAPGCRLVFWTDLFHIGGHDAGHTDITEDRDGFRRLVENLGFEIERETPHVDGRDTIQFGCLARKVAA